MMFSMSMEALLAILLAATVGYCAVLERRLRHLRNDQAGLVNIIRDLNLAIATAQNSLRALHGAADEAEQKLSHHVVQARALADELSLLASAGERIATRIENGQKPNLGNPRSEKPARVNGEAERCRHSGWTTGFSDLAGLRDRALKDML